MASEASWMSELRVQIDLTGSDDEQDAAPKTLTIGSTFAGSACKATQQAEGLEGPRPIKRSPHEDGAIHPMWAVFGGKRRRTFRALGTVPVPAGTAGELRQGDPSTGGQLLKETPPAVAVPPLQSPAAVLRPAAEAHIFDEPSEAFREHLASKGYVALRGVLPEMEIDSFLKQFWSELQQVSPSINPARRETWKFPDGFRGIVHTYGLPQASFAWKVRTLPKVHAAFARIFSTTDLCTSMDAVIMQDALPKCKPKPWLHKDQSIERSTDLSVQAVFTLFESGPLDAGTCLVPESHLVTYPWEEGNRLHHVRVPPGTGIEGKVVKPNLPPNTMLFFNSRLVHANQPASTLRSNDPITNLPRPGRIGACVAMAPKSRRSSATLRRKEAAYYKGECSTHWPCDNFALKPKSKWQAPLPGASRLPPPPEDPVRLALL
mmetsp:Transcript_21580/g.50334  ORF Transcript_21580/g.50334 Transcript_21580/m.50334 type:complete len:433 (-) Transcript_21580:22-1320(-)